MVVWFGSEAERVWVPGGIIGTVNPSETVLYFWADGWDPQDMPPWFGCRDGGMRSWFC